MSQTAAKTSEANAKASADTAAATLSNTVDLSSKQTITGAKTFAGDTTVTGQLISSGTNTLSGTTELEGTVELDSTAVATLNGKVTASNAGNSLKVANHDTALVSNDVLSAKDINTPNGDANSLVHRSGDEEVRGIKSFLSTVHTSYVSIDDPNYDDITKGPPSKGIGIKNISFKDSKGNTIAYLGPYVQTDGTVYIQLGVWSFTQNKIVVTNLVSQK